MTEPACPVTLVLDFDSLWCRLPANHTGPHEDHGEGGTFTWQIKSTP